MLEYKSLTYQKLDYYISEAIEIYKFVLAHLCDFPVEEVDMLNVAIDNLLFYANLINFKI